MIVASDALPGRTTDSTKPRNITAGTAGKPIVRGMNCTKRANAAGTNTAAGGMRMAIAGTATAIGTITTTIAIKL
jgi:hypothetical protein